MAWLGAGAALLCAFSVGEVERLWDRNAVLAVVGVLSVFLIGLPGYAFFQLGVHKEGTGWFERRWRPTLLARLALAMSVGAALYCGLVVAVRIARDWPA